MRRRLKTVALSAALCLALLGPGALARQPDSLRHLQQRQCRDGPSGDRRLDDDPAEPDRKLSKRYRPATRPWSIVPKKGSDILFVKPLVEKAETNVNIVTNKRVYPLLLVGSREPSLRAVVSCSLQIP